MPIELILAWLSSVHVETITVWLQFVAELLIFLGICYNTIQTCLTHRQINHVQAKVSLVATTTADTNTKVAAVEASSNGMRAALVTLTEREAFARGAKAGAAEERNRQNLETKT